MLTFLLDLMDDLHWESLLAKLLVTAMISREKIDCLRFVMCLLLAPHFLAFFLAVSINRTNEANKAGKYMPLSCLYYLDVYG